MDTFRSVAGPPPLDRLHVFGAEQQAFPELHAVQTPLAPVDLDGVRRAVPALGELLLSGDTIN